ncbi:hypothetical protein GA840_10405 [Pediococcus ethanolidurans]|uniref:KxYKxGKxW signal peptide domain-containing protein n=1 Tax=Pediococcus ethanolidurans TaxID=319653 RepID=UPI002954E347|nr:KxYKxGKxW signal peptide domain-containing protein [Pediococcus ethanolidurans]MDV7720235.1 hypothetical protein [Pediococcus ethanolidurans]
MLNNSRHNKQRQKLLYDTAQRKERFKMYKAGRNWLFAGITVLFFGTGVYMGPPEVSADSTVDTSSVTVASSSAASESSSSLQSSSSENSETTSAAASSDSTSSSATSSETTNADSLATPNSSSNSQESSAASTSEDSSVATSNASSSESDNSSAVLETSSVSSITSETASSAADSVETSEALSSATSLEAVTSETDQEKLATLGTELPAGTEVTVQSDGSILIALPSDYDDVALVQQVVDDAQLKSAVKITAKAAAASAYSYGKVTDSGALDDVTEKIGFPITIADFAFMRAVGTGTYVDENGVTQTQATSAEMYAYFLRLYNANSSNYRLVPDTNQSDTYYQAYYNQLSSLYFYFFEDSNSYINWLQSYLLNTMQLNSGTVSLVSMAQDAYNDTGSIDAVLNKTSDFLENFFPGVDAGSAGANFKNTAQWPKPAGIDDTTWENLGNLINGVVADYIGAIVPGAEKYVVNKVLPAVDTVSDTQALSQYSDIDNLVTQIGTESLDIANALMQVKNPETGNYEYSLSSLVPQIAFLYASISDSSVGSMIAPLLGLSSSATLGEVVGALTGSTTDGATLNGSTLNGIAFDDFSFFQPLYEAFSQAIIKALYGYAMVGKYQAIQAMYDGTLDAYIAQLGAGAAPSAIDPTAFQTAVKAETITVPNDVTTTMYQQWIEVNI